MIVGLFKVFYFYVFNGVIDIIIYGIEVNDR